VKALKAIAQMDEETENIMPLVAHTMGGGCTKTKSTQQTVQNTDSAVTEGIAETNLAVFYPVVHCRSVFSYFLFYRVQAFLDVVPADVNVCCIQPVVVDRDRVFLHITTIIVALLHNTMSIPSQFTCSFAVHQ